MSKLRILFVLFSLVVLAAPAGAQRREGDDHGHNRGDAEHKNRDGRAERDDDENERDDEDRVENRRGQRDDEENDDRDDEDGGRRGVNRRGCIDANGNNVCDITNGSLPTTLPEMVNAVLVSRGQLTTTGRRWLGANAVSPRYARSGNRTPSKVTWLNRSGAVTQVWLDTNRDGRADVVRMYRGGTLIRTVRR